MVVFHSVEISRFLYHSIFTWNQFWGFLKCKILSFNTFRGSEFWFLCIFSLFEDWNWPKEQNSQPLKLQKRQFLHFKNPQNWFHVKSEWYKNLEISTHCVLQLCLLWRKIDLTEICICVRYLFVIAATWDTKEGAIAKKWLMRPNFHLHLLFMGMIVIFLHGFSTLFQADDQFFFDQGMR